MRGWTLKAEETVPATERSQFKGQGSEMTIEQSRFLSPRTNRALGRTVFLAGGLLRALEGVQQAAHSLLGRRQLHTAHPTPPVVMIKNSLPHC